MSNFAMTPLFCLSSYLRHSESAEYFPEDLHDHAIFDYNEGDAFESFLLPVRHGVPVLSLNLPDLLSKPITFPDSSRLILCFNKKCQRQVAFNGCLYKIKEYNSETQWNNWRCVNPHCFGEIRTTPDFEVREVHPHVESCQKDEVQIRIRVAVYDARLMAEFTETPFETLHAGVHARFKDDI